MLFDWVKTESFPFVQMPMALGYMYISVLSSINVKPICCDCYQNEIFQRTMTDTMKRKYCSKLSSAFAIHPFIKLPFSALLQWSA